MRISDWSSDVCSSDLHRTSIRQSLLNAQGNATGQLFADGDELALDIAGPAVQPADHAFHRQDAAHRPQIARLYADLVHPELAVERFTAAQKGRTHRKQQGHVAARIVRAEIGRAHV